MAAKAVAANGMEMTGVLAGPRVGKFIERAAAIAESISELMDVLRATQNDDTDILTKEVKVVSLRERLLRAIADYNEAIRHAKNISANKGNAPDRFAAVKAEADSIVTAVGADAEAQRGRAAAMSARKFGGSRRKTSRSKKHRKLSRKNNKKQRRV